MPTPLIEVRSVSKQFSQEGPFVLKQVSFHVNEGDIFGIVGSSGAGKSTLMRLLTGQMSPTSGSILIEGVDIALLGQKELTSFRKKIGMVFQHFNLLSSRTVEENIAFPMEVHHVTEEIQKSALDTLLAQVRLQTKKKAYPATLSGGEKQRVGIARALANRPTLLFCDEATSALDPASTQAILDLLLELKQQYNITLVLITHQLEVVKKICNRVAVLSDGMLIEEGNVVDILTNSVHPETKRLLHPLAEELPPELKPLLKGKCVVSLQFQGEPAKDPLICRLIKTHPIEVNILLGKLENIQNQIVGSLVVELSGSEEEIQQALQFFSENQLKWELVI